jgi:pyridinium-3,5-bisthiocarboxylic acid mononucleotide nickel chelatase
MKTAYFDCPTGLAGNMILGALIDAGLDINHLKKELGKLQITSNKSQTNFKLQITKTKQNKIQATYLNVKTTKKEPSRNLSDILKIIKKSRLSKNVKKLSTQIFKRLAAAEAKVHGVAINKIHFHEVGAIDAIVDIVGTVIGLEKLGIEQIYCSPLPHGQGKIKHAHGILPNPAPATAELLKNIPTYGTKMKGELVTPTGAAIISTLAKGFGSIPRLTVEKIGYGAGFIKLPQANMIRLFIGQTELATERDAILQIETNIDDMDPALYNNVIEKLLKAGALDAYILPILMKKQRQAVNLVILCQPKDKEKVLNWLFEQTTTFGARVYLVPREKLSRKFKTVKTKYGKAKVKLGLLGNQLKTIAPEYEDYKRLAKKHHIPIKKTYEEIRRCI